MTSERDKSDVTCKDARQIRRSYSVMDVMGRYLHLAGRGAGQPAGQRAVRRAHRRRATFAHLLDLAPILLLSRTAK